MILSRRTLLAASAAASTLPLIRPARAQAPVLKIGVLNDLSGPYRDTGGVTSVICTKQAIEEFASAHGLNVQVISADHQNKPDLAVSIAASGSTATAWTCCWTCRRLPWRWRCSRW